MDGDLSEPLGAYVAALLERANASNIPSGILHWSFQWPYRIAEFDGDEWRGACDQPTWLQLYHELFAGQKGGRGMRPFDELLDPVPSCKEVATVPIAIACYRYDTPKRTFVAKVIRTARNNEVPPEPESADRILQQKTAFFASALLPTRSRAFEFLPYEHDGLEVSFVVPRSLFLSNIDGEPRDLEIDFDDGEGFRSVAFDEPLNIAYGDDLPKQIRLRVAFDGRSLGASFAFHVVVNEPVPVPNEVWELTGVESYRGVKATGCAWVYYRTGGNDIQNPMIFSDGFGAGPSRRVQLWNELDKGGLASGLRSAGKDLIVLGYNERSEYIQANAFVAAACIETIKKRVGATKKLVVAGASMGGLVTRYALLWLKDRHQTETYLSYDTPHSGAWVPLIVQKFAHYYAEQNNAEAVKQSKLMRSHAAQQMLYAYAPAWWFHGKFDSNDLREQFVDELIGMGNWPAGMKKYAVVNGRGDGVGNGIQPGAQAFNWSGTCAGAELHAQSQPEEEKFIGILKAGAHSHNCWVKGIPVFDGCPGGTREFFGECADGARSHSGNPNVSFRISCFIPSVSAVGPLASEMRNPFKRLADIPNIPFDEYIACAKNEPHVAVTPELRAFVIAKCAPKDEEIRSERRPRDSAAAP